MLSKKRIHLLVVANLVYVGLVILWDPIQRGFLHFDGAGRSIVLLTFLVLFLNLLYDKGFLKKYCLRAPVLFWILWVMYSGWNLAFEGYYGELSLFLFIVHQLVKPLVVMILTIKETMRDNVRAAKFLTCVFVVYAILSITVLGAGETSANERLMGDLGNLGPLNAVFIIFFASFLFVHRQIKITLLVVLIAISLTAIILPGTRKAFAAAIIIIAFLILSQVRLSIGRVVAGLTFSGVLWVGVTYALKATTLGERFRRGMEEGYERNTTGIRALDFLGDRATYYINGWSILKENLINGIGLQNYYYKGHGTFVLHSEYLVQLVEGGLVGSLLYLLFNYWLAKWLIKMCTRGDSRNVALVLAGAYVAILFIGITAWTYQFSFYFAVLGSIIAHIKILQNARRPHRVET